MGEDAPDDIDLQIVADSFRVVSDISAWDSLILSWERKIDQAGFGTKLESGEQRLKQHYSAIDKLLGKVGLPTAEDPIDHAVGSVTEPAMVLSEKFRVVAINPAGREAFRIEQGQVVHLDWLNDAYRNSFREFLSGPLSSRHRQYRIVRTLSADNREGYAEVFPVAVPGIEGDFTAVRELTMQWTDAIKKVLVQAFELTEAETEIARLLYLHADMAKVAQLRGVTVRTARLQLSHIFSKTETASQVELVRLLVLLGTRLSTELQNERLRWTDPLGREQIITRPDGRRLAYSWMGAKDGVPALFVHGIVNGYLYPDEFAATLKEHGVKLYVLTRPGTGNSDADRSIDTCTDHAETIAYFCKALNLKGIAAAGIHAGVVPLTKVAASNENPFSSIVAMGRFLTYSEKRSSKIAKIPRTLLWLTLNAPWAADIVGRHAWRALVQHGVDWYIERAYRDMPFDYKTTKHPEISPLLRNACAFTFLQGHEIFFDELVLRRTDIRDFLPKLRIPFRWMLGTVDVYGLSNTAGGFYDAEDQEEITSLNPIIVLERIPDCGELMPYQRPALVAQRIVEAAQGLECRGSWPGH